MIMEKTRQERLKEVRELIDRYGGNESGFSVLYQKLLEEYATEEAIDPNFRTNHYLNNLRQTRDKQASTYMYYKQKRPKKEAPQEYKDFVSNFRHDTGEATHL